MKMADLQHVHRMGIVKNMPKKDQKGLDSVNDVEVSQVPNLDLFKP